ncbi:MAG: hypothetical protein AAF570_24980, partial [Bacteroidota bacterium]
SPYMVNLPEIYAPSWIPTVTGPNTWWPTYYPLGIHSPIQAQTLNELYVLRRTDSLGFPIYFHWNPELPLLAWFNCQHPETGQTDSLFCPPKVGEKITVIRYLCNTKFSDVPEKRSSTSTMAVFFHNGGIQQTIQEDNIETPAVNALSCIPLVSEVTYQGPGEYVVETVADVNDDVKEAEEDNNRRLETGIENLLVE